MRLQFAFLGLLLSFTLSAQERLEGPIIKEFGNTYLVEKTDFKTDINAKHKVVFDVGRSFGNTEKPNALFESAARYINMHVQAGVPLENISVALVVHGDASKDLLLAEEYRSRYNIAEGVNNPNLSLITILAQNNVDIILCGQTAAHRNITKEKIHPNVQIALSAMTALVQLQNKGYRLINF